MTFGVLCLLSSLWVVFDPSQAAGDDGEDPVVLDPALAGPTPPVTDIPVEPQVLVMQQEVVTQQAEVVTATAVMVEELVDDTADLAAAVTAARFARLDVYAKSKGWVLDKMPREAEHDSEVQAWWAEWVMLSLGTP